MTDMEQKNEMQRRDGDNRFLAGIFIVGVGVLLLLQKLHFPIPSYIFHWPGILIMVGLYMGIKSNFQNSTAYIMLAIGGVFLLNDMFYNYDLHDLILPVILIIVGLSVVFRPKSKWRNYEWKRRYKDSWKDYTSHTFTGNESSGVTGGAAADNSSNTFEGEFLDINAVLGGVKRVVVSKNFKGGDVNCFMGGAEIYMLQADIQHPVTLEINAVFGGAKIVVPSDWDVKIETTAVLGGIDDKRNVGHVIPDTNKTLTIKGSCIFGGIEIRNF